MTLPELELQIRRNCTESLLLMTKDEYSSITDEQLFMFNQTFKVYAGLIEECDSPERIMELRGDLNESNSSICNEIRAEAIKKGVYNLVNWSIIMAYESFNAFYMPIYHSAQRRQLCT